jgi:hypothetical protein
VVGPRQRPKSRPPDGPTSWQSVRVGLEHRRFAASQSAICSRDVVAITGFTAACAARRWDGRRPTSTVECQTSWTTHELTGRCGRNPAPRHHVWGADRRQRRTLRRAQDPSIRVIEQGEVETAFNRAPLLKQCELEARIRLAVAIESPCSYGAAAGVAICGNRDVNARDSAFSCEVLWRAVRAGRNPFAGADLGPNH